MISGNSSWAEARLCDYDGQYYCTGCHWNSSAVIPARVIHNWDMDKRIVCQASAQLLKITARQPLIHLEQLNPKLFHFITELSFVKVSFTFISSQCVSNVTASYSGTNAKCRKECFIVKECALRYCAGQ